MNKTKIIAPCHWDANTVNIISQQNSSVDDVEISEFYGVLARGAVPHGRDPKSVPDITQDFALQFRRYLYDKGFKFVYLLNAPFQFSSEDQRYKVEEYLDWIVNEIKADAVTISSFELMQFVRNKYPELPIFVSTIAGVLTTEQFEKYLEISPSRVVLHHDANRNKHELESIVRRAEGTGADIELMLTESCIRGCPSRKAHYEYLSRQCNTNKNDTPFHTVCNTKKINHPRELLKANIIRPEDMHLYEEMGIFRFKITGRSKPPMWLPEVTNAYLTRHYEGNLVRLLGIDPSLNAEDWIFIDNRSLDGFLENFPVSGNQQDEDAYCDSWVSYMYKEGKFNLKDQTLYGEKEGELICIQTGEWSQTILNGERIK